MEPDRGGRRYGRPIARAPRRFVPGGIYHVFARGSNRGAIFIYDSDRVDFITCLGRVVDRHELRCLAYCLMPNHYHLVIQTPDDRLSHAMKELNGRYSRRFNLRYERDAHLFKNRFGAVLLESERQLLAAMRYLERNAVEAGLCAEPSEWPWSSFRALTGLDPAPPFLDRRRTLSYLGGEPNQAMARYMELVSALAHPARV